MKTQILIVDDLSMNRSILSTILAKDYDILEAENGQEAIDMICNSPIGDSISAIILDLVMPVMGGFEFLKQLSESEKFKNLPVLVTTASDANNDEEQALRLGAWDFVAKPYNTIVLQHRLGNIIARSQLQVLKELNFLSKYDSLTGIYNKVTFYKETSMLIQRNPQVQFALIHLNIKNFKLVNSFFGIENGDRILKLIADLLKRYCDKIPHSTYARIESDVFALCIPYDKGTVENDIELARGVLKGSSSQFLLHPTFGIFIVQDPTIELSIMFDYATMAARSIKEDYINCYIYYEEEMQSDIQQEQKIVSQMEQALLNEEFEVWFQPKYTVNTKEPYGAEALVRWRHPERGLISPGVFIPIFERNGFILRLDKYVWEKTCEYLGKWKKMGLPISPISVNVSRVNLYNPNLPEQLVELMATNNISLSSMPLEITEGIIAKDFSFLNNTLKRLKNLGFTIYMDDFGSGYSSLNVLKDVPIDTLKIDMRFFSETSNSMKSEIIIRSIVQMAQNLGLEIIAEGVEKEEQAILLHSIHCDYIQGFLYAKPMKAQDYEALVYQI